MEIQPIDVSFFGRLLSQVEDSYSETDHYT